MVCPQTNNTPHEYKVASSLKNGINNTRKVTINETKILKIKRSNPKIRNYHPIHD